MAATGDVGRTDRRPVTGLAAFSEVEVADPVVRDVAPSVPSRCGHIGIELPTGVRLTVDAMVDADALALVIAVLGR